jgi:hypothetical protein
VRSRLVAVAGLAFLGLALLSGCGSPDGGPSRLAGPPAKILMVNGYVLLSLVAQDEPLARTFANRTTYVLGANGPNAPAPAVPELAGTVQRTADYTSYAAFAADVAGGRVPGPDRAVLFDIEKWPATPLIEQQHPKYYMAKLSQLARAHGLFPILAPARDLVLVPGAFCRKRAGEDVAQAYLRCGLAGADAHAGALVVQSQVDQSNVPQFHSFVAHAVRQARAGNPHVTVLAQLATAPLGQSASLTQLVAAARSVGGFVQGFSLNARVSDIQLADHLLWSFKQS